MKQAIDLNADMGEYASDESAAIEAALMEHISSCSIACGGHAGDTETMSRTAQLARRHNVSIGAHPAYPDREGFGRRSLQFDSDVLFENLKTQITDLKQILDDKGVVLNHIKPHGALYNDAAKDADLAHAVTRAAREVAPNAILVGLPGSAVEKSAQNAGCRFAAEGFVDRLYQPDGALTPRSEEGAVIADINERANQAVAIASGEPLQLRAGILRLNAKTLCIHSDSPGAVETAIAVRAALQKSGFEITPFA